jgi:FkbM family methyltransferase
MSNLPAYQTKEQDIRLMERMSAQLEELSLLTRFHGMGAERTATFVYNDKKVTFYVPYALKDFIQRVILKTQSFYEVPDLEKFRSFVPASATIVDAGANIGNHSVFFALFCNARKIYAFEPMTVTFEILQRNASLNAPERIQCINAALGAAEGHATLLGYRANNFGAASVGPDAKGAYKLTTIDALALKELDIIKIDVEGSQADVLRGARDTLAKFSPRIWMEKNQAGHEAITRLGYKKVADISRNNFLYEK